MPLTKTHNEKFHQGQGSLITLGGGKFHILNSYCIVWLQNTLLILQTLTGGIFTELTCEWSSLV